MGLVLDNRVFGAASWNARRLASLLYPATSRLTNRDCDSFDKGRDPLYPISSIRPLACREIISASRCADVFACRCQ